MGNRCALNGLSLHLSTQPTLTPPDAHVGLSARQVKRRKATLGLTAYDYGSLEQDMALVAQVVEHAPSINLDDGYRQVRPLPLVFA